jgi:hypothetical protein
LAIRPLLLGRHYGTSSGEVKRPSLGNSCDVGGQRV